MLADYPHKYHRKSITEDAQDWLHRDLLSHLVCIRGDSGIYHQRGSLHSYLEGLSTNPEWGKLTDFQQAQTKQTFFEANIFSQVQDTGAEMTKMEDKGRCPTEYRLPPVLLGLHFLEILALGLLTFHTVFHGHAIFVYEYERHRPTPPAFFSKKLT